MQPLNNIHALIIDMDGVLWHGTQPLPGLTDFFKCLRNLKIPFILATNNASLTQDQYVKKLETMGVIVSRNEILTSSMATALYLSEHMDASSTSVYMIGEEGLRLPLIEQGFKLIESTELSEYEVNEVADIVVCGLDRSLTWEKMAIATLYIQAGAKFIASNADTSLPTERGPVLGNGAILAALQTATKVSPLVIGKPEPIMYQQAIKFLAAATENTVAIGDRLDTDILGAVNTGIRSIMVLCGISARDDLTKIDYQPTWVMDDIQAITAALQKEYG
jgi:4-nitrophenyl phosphatase